jgi:hypothetical protein
MTKSYKFAPTESLPITAASRSMLAMMLHVQSHHKIQPVNPSPLKDRYFSLIYISKLCETWAAKLALPLKLAQQI